MITAELIEDEKKKELIELSEKAQELVKALEKEYPGREVRIALKDYSVDYWLDGNCYSINRTFYFS